MATETTREEIDEAMKTLRRVFPMMRRECSTAIIHSGGKRTIFGCLCGARHTTSTEWRGRDARHVWEWQQAHGDCCVKIANDLKVGPVEVTLGSRMHTRSDTTLNQPHK